MEAIDLTELLLPYKNTFVALSNDYKKVVGKGPTVDDVVNEATGNGESEPIVMWVPNEWLPVCL